MGRIFGLHLASQTHKIDLSEGVRFARVCISWIEAAGGDEAGAKDETGVKNS